MMNCTSPFQPHGAQPECPPNMMGRDILSLSPSTPTGHFRRTRAPPPRGGARAPTINNVRSAKCAKQILLKILFLFSNGKTLEQKAPRYSNPD